MFKTARDKVLIAWKEILKEIKRRNDEYTSKRSDEKWL